MADDTDHNRQFPDAKPGIPAARVFVDEGQPGGREVTVPGLLGAPLRPAPHGNPGALDISPTVRAALSGFGPEKAGRVRDVLRRKAR
jgi:hypothetical protein